jgi:citrate lyase subunit beta/citryl-CoA lyase
MNVRPRRSVLYMPGSNVRALEKAKTLSVDGVILDLEDSVAPEAKEDARQKVTDAVKTGGFGKREVFIRVNSVDTPWHADDLAAAAHAEPDAILVPKVSSPDTLELIGRRLLDMGTHHKTRVWAMIETPLAIFNVLRIAAAASDSETRLSGFVMGTNDLAKDTRARLVPGRAPMLTWLSMCVAAARIYGVDILDGVYNDIGNADGFVSECAQGVELGFDGKTLIHPSQIELCNKAFSPSQA